MKQFYADNCLKESGLMPGGKFNGPRIKFILNEDKLCELENLLSVEATPIS